MAQTDAEPPTSTEQETQMRTRVSAGEQVQRPLLSWPLAVAAIVVALVVVLAGGSLLLRQLTVPAGTPLGTVPATVVTPGVTAAAIPTAAAPTLAPATLPPAPGAVSTARPTTVPTRVPTPAPTLGPTARPVAGATEAPSATTPLPTVAPELRREVENAYTQYWDARAQAVWTLDASPLDAVATGEELVALRRDVDQLRNDGRAIKAEVQHQYTVVRVEGDQAQVLDRFRDFSIYVDAATKQQLPGQVRPDESSAPLSTALYHLQRGDGTWRVERGERYANE